MESRKVELKIKKFKEKKNLKSLTKAFQEYHLKHLRGSCKTTHKTNSMND